MDLEPYILPGILFLIGGGPIIFMIVYAYRAEKRMGYINTRRMETEEDYIKGIAKMYPYCDPPHDKSLQSVMLLSGFTGGKMAKKRKTRSRKWWAAELKKREESGLSLAEYARQHGINAGTMYRWQSLLADKPHKSSLKKNAVKKTNENAAVVDGLPFVELMSAYKPNQSFKLETPGGWVVRIDSQISEERLAAIVRVLEQCS